jgi:hypothetical protein
MNLKKAFNKTETENGDIAYNSSLNKYIDTVFKLVELRKKPSLVSISLDKDSEYDKWFARVIRDCRYGFGEREVGRKLLGKIEEDPENVFNIGRADDIFELGWKLVKSRKDLKGGKYWEYLINVLTDKVNSFSEIEKYNVKKWMPRERKNNLYKVKAFTKAFEINLKSYRKLISNNNTTEAILSRGDIVEDYSKVPSLAMLKHFNTFIAKDNERFEKYLEDVKKGKSKMNTGTMTPYDISLKYNKGNIKGEDADLIFNSLPKIDFGRIIPIVDNSYSMYDGENSYLKARAIGHYVAKNSSYLNNHIISFSSQAKLLELSDNYEDDMKIMCSYNDVSNTDFGNVMKTLSKVTEDLPDFLLVLSDMQFDMGSSMSKDEAMKILKTYNPNLRIIWWNFNVSDTTFPETDEYGNIFLSGYNPTLLKFLEVGFDGQQLIDNIIENYKSKMKDIIK